MVLKVKEPQPPEVEMLRPGQLLFTYLHLAPDPELTRGLCDSGATCIAYETVEDARGRLPLLAPMSEIAGKIATQAGAFMLEKPLGGRGILLGGVPGVAAANVMVIGGGVVGMNAAFIAIGMEADVFVFDKSIDRLRELEIAFAGRCSTVYSTTLAIEEMLPRADLVIGAVLVHGARAPFVVRREQLALMKPGAVLVDVAIDQGGCFETSRPTTHQDPTFEVDGITHYCVANMPGAVPITSTHALTNATLPYAIALADEGVAGRDPARPGPAARRQRRRRGGHPPGGRRRRRRGLRPGRGGPELKPAADGPETGHMDAIRPIGPNLRRRMSDGYGGEDEAEELHRRQGCRSGRGRDGGRGQPGHRRGDRRGAALDQAGRRRRGRRGARAPSPGWAATPPGERARALLRMADLIEERGEEIADLEAADAGKPRSAVVEDEIPVMADQLRFFAGAARTMEGRAAGEYMEGHTSFIRREPIGVVGQITPWNYPLMMAIWKIGPALAAGNTVVLKPAETTPLATLQFAEWCAEILPAGVFNVIGGHGDPTGAELVTHPDVGMVCLTGSPPTGKWIAKAAADTPEAGPPRARRQGAGGDLRRRRHGGGDGDDRRHRLLQRRPGLHGRDPRARRQGRLRRRRQRPRRRSQGPGPRRHDVGRHDPGAAQLRPPARAGRGLPRAQAGNAEIVTGGVQPDLPGFFLEPAVVAGLEQGDEMIQDEIFGPVITVQPLRRRGEGDRVGQRHPLRARLLGLDPRRRPRDAGRQRARVRLRLDQRPHPARLRDAARRLQAVRLRQGPLDLRARGLHRDQARDGQPRLGPSPRLTSATR